jgi:hypothetical protein
VEEKLKENFEAVMTLGQAHHQVHHPPDKRSGEAWPTTSTSATQTKSN